jgi:hypothetical protein
VALGEQGRITPAAQFTGKSAESAGSGSTEVEIHATAMPRQKGSHQGLASLADPSESEEAGSRQIEALVYASAQLDPKREDISEEGLQ